MEKKLAKIRSVYFGKGGYQDAEIGISLSFEGDKGSWGCATFEGTWATTRSEHAKWKESERLLTLGNLVMKINTYLEQAKVNSVEKLKGIPVELTFDAPSFGKLISWRILEEVL